MNVHPFVSPELVKETGRFTLHALALVVGMIFMFTGIAMGVSIVMLPIGIPLGFVGLLLFGWGVFERAERKTPPAQPRAPSTPQ
jgi:hypothetical protein